MDPEQAKTIAVIHLNMHTRSNKKEHEEQHHSTKGSMVVVGNLTVT